MMQIQHLSHNNQILRHVCSTTDRMGQGKFIQ
jgi:hypothetical protein